MNAPRARLRARRLQILTGVAAGLSLLAMLVHLPSGNRTDTDDRLGKPVIEDFSRIRADAAEIRVTLADESYALVNGANGWTLRSANNYPVRADRLAQLSSGLETLEWGLGRTRDPNKFGRVGVSDPRDGGTGALIEVVNTSGDVSAALITGRKDDLMYARRPEDTRAYRVTGSLPPLYNADAWLDLNIIDIHADAVSAVRLFDSRGQSLFLTRSPGASDRSFRPAPPFQDYKLVSRIAASTPALALSRFQPIGVRPEKELTTRPVARHITQTHDGLEVDLRAYREPDGFFVTLRAVEAGEGAQRGITINEKATGWAFQLTEYDWNDFTPSTASIVRPPAAAPTPTR